jgi:hypothetical protein
LAAILVLAFAGFCWRNRKRRRHPRRPRKPKPRMSKAALLKNLSANETRLWNAWKNKDSKPFQNWLAATRDDWRKRSWHKEDVTEMMANSPCDYQIIHVVRLEADDG